MRRGVEASSTLSRDSHNAIGSSNELDSLSTSTTHPGAITLTERGRKRARRCPATGPSFQE